MVPACGRMTARASPTAAAASTTMQPRRHASLSSTALLVRHQQHILLPILLLICLSCSSNPPSIPCYCPDTVKHAEARAHLACFAHYWRLCTQGSAGIELNQCGVDIGFCTFARGRGDKGAAIYMQARPRLDGEMTSFKYFATCRIPLGASTKRPWVATSKHMQQSSTKDTHLQSC